MGHSYRAELLLLATSVLLHALFALLPIAPLDVYIRTCQGHYHVTTCPVEQFSKCPSLAGSKRIYFVPQCINTLKYTKYANRSIYAVPMTLDQCTNFGTLLILIDVLLPCLMVCLVHALIVNFSLNSRDKGYPCCCSLIFSAFSCGAFRTFRSQA